MADLQSQAKPAIALTNAPQVKCRRPKTKWQPLLKRLTKDLKDHVSSDAFKAFDLKSESFWIPNLVLV